MAMTLVAASAGSTTSVSVKSASMAGYLQGPRKYYGGRFSKTNTKTITTEEVILSFRVRNHYHGYTCHHEARALGVSFATDGNKNVTFRLIYAPTTIGDGSTSDYPDWQYVDENTSIVEYDTTADSYTGGQEVFDVVLGKTEGRFISLVDFDIVGSRGTTFLISAQSSQSSEVSASLLWEESS